METYAYRIYMSDSLYLHGQNKAFTAKWNDLMEYEPTEYDDMDADEIALTVIKKAGLTFKEGGE